MKNLNILSKISGLALLLAVSSPTARANIVSVAGPNSSAGTAPAIIAAPSQVLNAAVFNTGQQGFDERQGVLLGAPLDVDGVADIPTGTLVNSHMIFLNRSDRVTAALQHEEVVWTFDGLILGVMSDQGGTLEAASSGFLGNPATTYPAAFSNRGLESNDSYSVAGNQITVNMHVTQPGDWIRVITEPGRVPDGGSTVAMLGVAIAGLAGFAARRR